MGWTTPTVDEFLQKCSQSGDAAYAALRSLLEGLEDLETRSQARIFLSLLQKRFPTKDSCDQCFQTYHFRIEDILLDQYEGKWDLLSFDSFIFLIG
jgi:methionine S-methyltransferase